MSPPSCIHRATNTTPPKDTTMMNMLRTRAHLGRALHAQAARADSAEARSLELEAALSDLTRAIGTCRQRIYLDAGMLNRLNAGSSRTIRAPHDQDPRVQSALTEARRALGRAL